MATQGSKATLSTTTNAIHHLDDSETKDDADEKIAEIKAMLTDLTEIRLHDEEDEIGTFEEDEAAEILAVMLKEKKKTYLQSAQIKKDRELGRSYRQTGKGSGKDGSLRSGTYKLSITELKQRTRCRRCGKLGHWQKECPVPAGQAKEQQAHFLEVDFDEPEGVMLCHCLEGDSENVTGGRRQVHELHRQRRGRHDGRAKT